jgi:hypothetical protein
MSARFPGDIDKYSAAGFNLSKRCAVCVAVVKSRRVDCEMVATFGIK